MPKRAKELSPLEVRRLKHPGGEGKSPASFPVGGVAGLMLQITSSGARSWVLRITVHGKRRELGLGPFPEVTLAKAREQAAELRAMVRDGRDPLAEREAMRVQAREDVKRRITFGDAVELYLDAKLPEIPGNRQREIVAGRLRDYAIPVLGNLPVAHIEAPDVLRVIEPIWSSKNETAKRTRGHIENLLSWATVMNMRKGENPARWTGNLKELLPDLKTGDNHRPALQVADAPRWYRTVMARTGIGSRALLWTALTAARSGEVRGMTWDELDFDAKLWLVPATRMKMNRPHRVPLSELALKLLGELKKTDHLVFPAPRGGPLSDMTLLKAMRTAHDDDLRAGGRGYIDSCSRRPAVVHGLRSTFRVWAAENGIPRDMAEIALAHRVGSDVERAYMRSDMLERRRGMMDRWAIFLQGKKAAEFKGLMDDFSV